jgi:hypothetical protein
LIASLIARAHHRIGNPATLPVIAFLGAGIALTIGFEFYYTQVTNRETIRT